MAAAAKIQTKMNVFGVILFDLSPVGEITKPRLVGWFEHDRKTGNCHNQDNDYSISNLTLHNNVTPNSLLCCLGLFVRHLESGNRTTFGFDRNRLSNSQLDGVV